MRNGFHFIGKDYFIKTPTKRDNTGNYTDYNTGRESKTETDRPD